MLYVSVCVCVLGSAGLRAASFIHLFLLHSCVLLSDTLDMLHYLYFVVVYLLLACLLTLVFVLWPLELMY